MQLKFIFFNLLIVCTANQLRRNDIKRAKCLSAPHTAERVEAFIGICQEEVRNKLVNEAFEILKESAGKTQAPIDPYDYSIHLMEVPDMQHPDKTYVEQSSNAQSSNSRIMRHVRHDSELSAYGGIDHYHATLVPFEEKRIAGCLLHCVYAKNNAIDSLGWPTLDGLVDFYSEGVNEHGFFMATLRSVNLCLRAATNKYNIDRHKLPEHGESCDMAFEVFDCISDQITGYCLDHYKY